MTYFIHLRVFTWFLAGFYLVTAGNEPNHANNEYKH